MNPRGPLSMATDVRALGGARRRGADDVVAAPVGAALAVFAGQALPQAVRHDLVVAPGTAMVVSGRSQAAPRRRPRRRCDRASPGRWTACRSATGRASGPTRSASWPGRCPPSSQLRSEYAAAPGRLAAGRHGYAVLVSGRWPRGSRIVGRLDRGRKAGDRGRAARERGRAAGAAPWRRLHVVDRSSDASVTSCSPVCTRRSRRRPAPPPTGS